MGDSGIGEEGLRRAAEAVVREYDTSDDAHIHGTIDALRAALATADKPLTGRDESAAAKLAAWFEWAKYVAPTDQPGWHHWWAKAFLNDGPIPSPTAPALDVEALYRAILDELVVLWGEPSDAVSVQVRPIVARSIADRYAALSAPATGGTE